MSCDISRAPQSVVYAIFSTDFNYICSFFITIVLIYFIFGLIAGYWLTPVAVAILINKPVRMTIMMTGILMVSLMVLSFSCGDGQPTTASITTTAATTAAVTIVVEISDSILGGSQFFYGDNRGDKCFYYMLCSFYFCFTI